MSRDIDHAYLEFVITIKTNTSRANPCTKFDDSISSATSEKFKSV